MKDENRDRMGDKFEREMSDLFQRIGFVVKNHVFTRKEDGRKSEQDVLATKGNLKILIQCKDYAKFPFENLEEVLKDLIEDGKSLEADRLILAITGHKNLSEDYTKSLKKKGIYLWNEDYWRKLQRLDLIDLYEEIGKNLEIKEVLKRVKDEEEQKLKSLYDKIEKIEDKSKKKSIFEQLEKIEFSDYTKREIQLKKIENEILFEKEKEVDEKAERDIEDIELEELFSMVKRLDLDFNKRYLILDKIRGDIDLSKKSGKIIDIEKIKTFIEKQEENLEDEKWGDTKIDDLEDLRDNGEISQKDYERLRGRVKGMGVSKKGFANAERKSFEYELKKSKSLTRKRKFFKIVKFSFILIISLVLLFLIFHLFNSSKDSNNLNNLTEEYSKIIQTKKFNGQSYSSSPTCKTSFVIENTINKQVSFKIEYIILYYDHDGILSQISKELNLSLNGLETLIVADGSGTWGYHNCEIDKNSIRILYQLNLEENPNETISQNQDLLDFCKIKFNVYSQNSKLYDYEYFDNYQDAKIWIYNLFPEEIEINRNRAKFFTEWYLDKAEFPIYILQGSISSSSSLVESGYYVCDKKGIVERG